MRCHHVHHNDSYGNNCIWNGTKLRFRKRRCWKGRVAFLVVNFRPVLLFLHKNMWWSNNNKKRKNDYTTFATTILTGIIAFETERSCVSDNGVVKRVASLFWLYISDRYFFFCAKHGFLGKTDYNYRSMPLAPNIWQTILFIFWIWIDREYF